MITPPRVTVIGAEVNACRSREALEMLAPRLQEGGGGYVCFTNAHAAVMCYEEDWFRVVTAESFLSLADGMPVYWAGRARGAPIGHCPGPDFMLKALQRYPQRRHFFYGSTPATLDALVRSIAALVPDVQICGHLSPPFRKLAAEEASEILRSINATRPDFIWVGLGAPKQERWMSENWRALRPALLFGVGAAFDFHSGTVSRAPAPVRFLGFEWLHRLLQEPRRLWRRYLVTNSKFLYYCLKAAADPRPRPRPRPPRERT